ncbi:hypothetical protein B296_00031093, partial [Ensete ventricosum]
VGRDGNRRKPPPEGGGGAHGEPPPLKRFPKAERRWGHRPLECRLAAVRLTLPVGPARRHRNIWTPIGSAFGASLTA